MSRLPRFKRVATVARIRLTERDHKIIRLTHRHRFLRSHQIIALIGGSAQNLSRRLQWLFHHGYLERPRAQLQYYERGGSKTIAYGLGNKSGSLLQLNPAAWGEKNRAIGRMYLAHALLVSDVMVSLELACRQRGIRLLHEDELNLPVETPLHWRVKLRDGTKLGVIPDRVFALEYADQNSQLQRVYYFLEADRGTTPVVREKLAQSSFYRKLLAFEATWANKVHQRHLGLPRFRVLTVTTSAARVKSLLDACSRLQRGHGLFLFADRTVLEKDLLSAIWQCGKPLPCWPPWTCRIWQVHTSPDFFRRTLAWPVEADPLQGCHVHHNHKHRSIIMSKTAFVDFKAVKAAITMEQVLEHYGLLEKFKRGTDSLNGPCPIHKGSNPTQFRVSLSKNIWNCFSECKHGGNVLDFIAEMENVSIHAAALKAIEWFKLDPEALAANSDKGESGETERPAPAPKVAAKPASSPKPAPESSAPNTPLKFRLDKLERSHPYLIEQRCLTPETVVDFGIGFCSKGMMADRIAIPIHNVKGEVVAYAGRFPGEPGEDTPKYKLPPGFRKSQELYNLDRAVKQPADQPLVIVEGFFDAMKLHQNGCYKVVALMGSTMSAAQEELIRQHTNSQSHVIVMLDENEAGKAGREDIACRLSKLCFVRVLQFDQPDMEPEHLTAEEVQQLMEGVR